MKFMRALTLIYIIDLLVIFSVTLAQEWNQLSYGNEAKRSHRSCRFPLFNCRLINKFRSTKRETGLRATGQPNPNINNENGVYDPSQSSLHPSYALPVYAGSSHVPSYYANTPYMSASNEFPAATVALSGPNDGQHTPYGPQSQYTAQNYGQSPNTIDVHQVLDQFIRSAGLSPQGDHESEAAHSSSFAKAGTKPVLTFKKLLSFPFYLSTDPNVVDIYGKNWK